MTEDGAVDFIWKIFQKVHHVQEILKATTQEQAGEKIEKILDSMIPQSEEFPERQLITHIITGSIDITTSQKEDMVYTVEKIDLRRGMWGMVQKLYDIPQKMPMKDMKILINSIVQSSVLASKHRVQTLQESSTNTVLIKKEQAFQKRILQDTYGYGSK
jgi:hypothetical protein